MLPASFHNCQQQNPLLFLTYSDICQGQAFFDIAQKVRPQTYPLENHLLQQLL